jgi:hypothetical protein
MEESETIVADLACRLGDRRHVSPGDNAPASVSWGHAEGLASRQAATLGNRCSVVRGTTRTWFKWSGGCAEPSPTWVKALSAGKSGGCARGAPRRRGGGMTVKGLECKAGKSHAL